VSLSTFCWDPCAKVGVLTNQTAHIYLQLSRKLQIPSTISSTRGGTMEGLEISAVKFPGQISNEPSGLLRAGDGDIGGLGGRVRFYQDADLVVSGMRSRENVLGGGRSMVRG